MSDRNELVGQVNRHKPNQLSRVSERKLKANRENAKKSTGPRTIQGQEHSRRNALKHGLFVRRVTDFEALDEDPQEYDELLDGLWSQYRPIGRLEELEVERIALCCWRLKRAWRYENAMTLAARRDFVRAELDYQKPYCKERDKEESAALVLLQSAKEEVERAGEVSQELKQRIFSTMQGLDGMWSALEKTAEELMDDHKLFRRLDSPKRTWARDIFAVTHAISAVEELSDQRWTKVREAAIGRHALPDSDALDKILRYEAAVNRDLGRSLDRIERLQRQRHGETIPPPVSVRLTR